MKRNREIKKAAWAALKGNWSPAVVGAIFLSVITTLFAAPAYCLNMATMDIQPFSDMNPMLLLAFSNSSMLLNFFLLYPLGLGYAVAHKDLYVNGDARVTRNTVMHTFKGYLRNLLTLLLVYVFVVLWSLLFLVPGIVKGYAYAMAPFIIKDNPELSPNQAINLSMKMMKGHKFQLFCLYLSFLGWVLLSVITLGVALLWVMPYMQTAFAAFYQEVRNEYLTRESIK